MSSDPKNLVGTTLSGRYKVERPIGEGGMGAVFEATQLSLGRRVAIKVVKPASAGSTDDEVMKRFERETEVISRLNHPNIVQVVDGGRADEGILYLAMELLDGESVRMVLKRDGAIPVTRALAIIEDVLSALVAAHGGGVIHRDLKAENVMLVVAAGKSEIAKVLDFGVAKVTTQTEAPPVTGSGFVAGTPGCIAPEQMLGKSDDPRSDLYSVGVLLFEMLAGQGPFAGASSMELMMKHLTEPAPRVADVARGRGKAEVPGPIDELVASLLSKDPAMRPASAQAALEIVRGLRDASRATQPDVRIPMPTPQGAFQLGSRVVAMPGMPGALVETAPSTALSPGLSPAPSLAQTSPTTAMPMPATRRPVTRLKKAFRAAVLVGVVLAVASGVGKVLSWDAERFSRVEEAEQLIEAAIVDYQKLETKAAREKVNRALQIDPEGAAMAYLLRGQLNILDEGSLARVDEDSGRAMEVAKGRSAAMAIQTHTEGIADALKTLDPMAARIAFDNHERTHRCYSDPLHHQMFALRYGLVKNDQAEVEALFLDEDSGYEHLLTAYGVARARFRAGNLAGAREVAEKHIGPRGAGNVLVENLLADFDLAEGRDDLALTRLKRVVLESEDLRTKIRVAVLEADKRRGAFDDVIQRVETTRSPGSQERIDTWALLGHLYATSGRLSDAKRMWSRAYDESVQVDDSIGRRLELVAFAELFSVLLGDLAEADRLRRLFDREYKKLAENPVAERLRALSIANSILIDVIDVSDSADGKGEKGEATAASIARDLQDLRNTRADIPLIVPATEWHVLVSEGKLAEALAAAKALKSPCWSHAWVGETALARLKRATTEGERQAARADARAAFKEASSEKNRNVCTRSFDLLSWLQKVVYARSVARQVLAAEPLDSAQLVEVIAQYERMWPWADEDTGVARVIALARKELGSPEHVHAPVP